MWVQLRSGRWRLSPVVSCVLRAESLKIKTDTSRPAVVSTTPVQRPSPPLVARFTAKPEKKSDAYNKMRTAEHTVLKVGKRKAAEGVGEAKRLGELNVGRVDWKNPLEALAKLGNNGASSVVSAMISQGPASRTAPSNAAPPTRAGS